MSAVIMALAPFVLNVVMGAMKWAGAQDMTTPGKRTLLAVFAIVGVAAANGLTGTPVQVDSISSLTQIALESFAAFVAAHGTYLLFWKR